MGLNKNLPMLGVLMLLMSLLLVVDVSNAASPRPAATLVAVPPAGAPGAKLVLRGGLTSKVKRPVQLQVRRSGAWRPVGRRGQTNQRGKYSFRTVIPATTSAYRVVAPATKVRGRTYPKVTTPTRKVRSVPPTQPAEPSLVASAVVGACEAAPSVTLDSDPSVAVPGDELTYDATIRNDATGFCLRSGTVPSVDGVIDLSLADADDVTVDDIVMWLEVPGVDDEWLVLPLSSGLGREPGAGAPAGDACPGESADGCGPEAQVTYGNVRFEADLPVAVGSGGTAVPFRFFPRLEPDDIDYLDLCAAGESDDPSCSQARLVVVATSDLAGFDTIGGTRAVEQDEQSGAADELAVTVTTPEGELSEPVQLGRIAPGEQIDAVDAASYVVPDGAGTELVASAVLTYQADGSPSSKSAVARTFVEGKAAGLPALTLVTERSAVTSGSSDSLFFSSTGAAAGPVAVRRVDGPSPVLLGTLDDEGLDGDLLAGDGVYSANLDVPFDEAGTVQLQATDAGTDPMTSEVLELDVTPAGVPVRSADGPIGSTIQLDDADVRADQLLVRLDESGTYDDAVAAATAVDGTVVGRIDESWQVGFASVDSAEQMTSKLETVSLQTHVIGAETVSVGATDVFVPNDPSYGQQYAHRVTRTNEAWVVEPGAAVIVAVIDEGVQSNHPDLTGRVLSGKNFLTGSTNTEPAAGESHGTHVAGIIASRKNNGVGVAGVNSNARILPVKVCGLSGCVGNDKLAEAIRYATARGARVINMSLGGYGRSEAVAAALQEAYFANVLVVVSAGNCGDPNNWQLNGCSGLNVASYPAKYESSETFSSWFGLVERTYYNSVMAVGSTTSSNQRSSFSTHGDFVDISAPGSDILSTVDGSAYGLKSGTSMASPYVAGVASLVFSRRPDYLDLNVRSVMLSSAHKLSASGMGAGLVDTFSALTNGGFEFGDVREWNPSGTTSSVKQLGPIVPADGTTRMGLASTGPGSTGTEAQLLQRLPIAPGSGRVTVSLRYNFVTEEYPEYVGSSFNDVVTFRLRHDDGTVREIVQETVNATAFTPVSGIDFPGGDDTVGQSGWRTVTVSVDPPETGATLLIDIRDVGDGAYDSVVLVDGLRIL